MNNLSSQHLPPVYKRYSHLGGNTKGRKRNFYAYAKDASEIMQEPAIKKQFSKAWENLLNEIEKYEMKYELNK